MALFRTRKARVTDVVLREAHSVFWGHDDTWLPVPAIQKIQKCFQFSNARPVGTVPRMTTAVLQADQQLPRLACRLPKNSRAFPGSRACWQVP